jgi:hypothetical protein
MISSPQGIPASLAAEVSCNGTLIRMSVPKDPQRGCLGWHVTKFRIQYIKTAPAGEKEPLWQTISKSTHPVQNRTYSPGTIPPAFYALSPERKSPNTSPQLPRQRDCLASKDTAFALEEPPNTCYEASPSMSSNLWGVGPANHLSSTCVNTP